MKWINKIATSVVIVGTTLGVGGVASAQSLPPVRAWNINANGSQGSLIIRLDPQTNNLTGTVLGDAIRGFWDDFSNKITFIRMNNGASPETAQVYTGYMFNQGQLYTLAGSFEAFRSAGGIAGREVFGWYAEGSLF